MSNVHPDHAALIAKARKWLERMAGDNDTERLLLYESQAIVENFIALASAPSPRTPLPQEERDFPEGLEGDAYEAAIDYNERNPWTGKPAIVVFVEAYMEGYKAAPKVEQRTPTEDVIRKMLLGATALRDRALANCDRSGAMAFDERVSTLEEVLALFTSPEAPESEGK